MKKNKDNKGKLVGLQRRKAKAGYLFILPFIIGFLVFMVKPLAQSFYMGFCEVELGSGQFNQIFTGIENFKYAFTVDPEFNRLLVEEVTRMMIDSVTGNTDDKLLSQGFGIHVDVNNAAGFVALLESQVR